jgi:Fe2+ transport system protein FeoA
MTLLNATKNQTYLISSISECDEAIKSRFFQLGFIPGRQILLRRKAPLFGDPLLIEIDDSQVALTKTEANLIQIQQLEA